MKKSIKSSISKSLSSFSLFAVDKNCKKSDILKPSQNKMLNQINRKYYRNASLPIINEYNELDLIKNQRKDLEILRLRMTDFEKETKIILKPYVEDQVVANQIKTEEYNSFQKENKENKFPFLNQNLNDLHLINESSALSFESFGKNNSRIQETYSHIEPDLQQKMIFPFIDEANQNFCEYRKDSLNLNLNLTSNENENENDKGNIRINNAEKQLKFITESSDNQNKIITCNPNKNELKLSNRRSERRLNNNLSDSQKEFIIKALKNDSELIENLKEDSRKYLDSLFEKFISLNLPNFEIKLFDLYELIKVEYQEFFDLRFNEIGEENYKKWREQEIQKNNLLLQSFEEKLSQNAKEISLFLEELKNMKFQLIALEDFQMRNFNLNPLKKIEPSKSKKNPDVKYKKEIITESSIDSSINNRILLEKLKSDINLYKKEIEKLIDEMNIKISQMTSNSNSDNIPSNISSSLQMEKLNNYNIIIEQMINEKFNLFKESNKIEINNIYERISEIFNKISILKYLPISHQKNINFVENNCKINQKIENENAEIIYNNGILINNKSKESNQGVQYDEIKIELLNKEEKFSKEKKAITFNEESSSSKSIRQHLANKTEYSDQRLSQESLTAKSTKELDIKELKYIHLSETRKIWNNTQTEDFNFMHLIQMFQKEVDKGIMNKNNHILVHILGHFFNEINSLSDFFKTNFENCFNNRSKDKFYLFDSDKTCKYCSLLQKKTSSDLFDNDEWMECRLCENLAFKDIIPLSNKDSVGNNAKCLYCLKRFCHNCLGMCSFCSRLECKICRRKCLFKNINKTKNAALITHFNDIQWNIKEFISNQNEFQIIPKVIRESYRVTSINISNIDYITEDMYKDFITSLKFHRSLVKFYSVNLSSIHTKKMISIINMNANNLGNLKKFYVSGSDFYKEFDEWREKYEFSKIFEISKNKNESHKNKKTFILSSLLNSLFCAKFSNKSSMITIQVYNNQLETSNQLIIN